MINHDIQQFRLPTERRMNKYAKAALGGAAAVAVGLLASEGIRDDPKYTIENKANQVTVTTIDLVAPITPEHIGPIELNSVSEGEATSDAIERATLAFIQKYGVITKEGQSSTIQENAKTIDEITQETTNGSVQPDTKFETWYDTESGHIISSLPIEIKD